MITSNDATRIVGPHLRIERRIQSIVSTAPEHASHVGLFGDAGHSILGALRVGIVGLGSVGAHVNLQLARLGVGRIGGMDFDRVEQRNLNRLPARRADARRRRLKVDVARREAIASTTAERFRFDCHFLSIVEDAGVSAALDYVLLFSCADSHWSRQVLNAIAYAHLIPVIDGGTHVASRDAVFQTASFRVQAVGPGRGCLACGGGFDPARIGEEMSGLYAPHYAGDAANAVGEPSVIALNTALASHEVLRFMEVVLRIADQRELARQRFDYRGGDMQLDVIACAPGCRWRAEESRGDAAYLPTGLDPRFARARADDELRARRVHSIASPPGIQPDHVRSLSFASRTVRGEKTS